MGQARSARARLDHDSTLLHRWPGLRIRKDRVVLFRIDSLRSSGLLRQPVAHIPLMVIAEMVEELTGGVAFAVQPDDMPLRLDTDIVGQAFDDRKELLEDLLCFLE